jgi:hypothetical protein
MTEIASILCAKNVKDKTLAPDRMTDHHQTRLQINCRFNEATTAHKFSRAYCKLKANARRLGEQDIRLGASLLGPFRSHREILISRRGLSTKLERSKYPLGSLRILRNVGV